MKKIIIKPKRISPLIKKEPSEQHVDVCFHHHREIKEKNNNTPKLALPEMQTHCWSRFLNPSPLSLPPTSATSYSHAYLFCFITRFSLSLSANFSLWLICLIRCIHDLCLIISKHINLANWHAPLWILKQ